MLHDFLGISIRPVFVGTVAREEGSVDWYLAVGAAGLETSEEQIW